MTDSDPTDVAHSAQEHAGAETNVELENPFERLKARAASVGALGHGRLPGSYEELVAAR